MSISRIRSTGLIFYKKEYPRLNRWDLKSRMSPCGLSEQWISDRFTLRSVCSSEEPLRRGCVLAQAEAGSKVSSLGKDRT